MSKTLKTPIVDLEPVIMEKVRSKKISMKPKWYFVVGSLLTITGLAGVSIGAIFLTNLTLFLIRQHGPIAQWRLQQLLITFPWWVPILAIISMGLGIWLLQKYDFSYKKNFTLIILGFILSTILTAWAIDYLGLNDIWLRRGPMKRFYRQSEERVWPSPRRKAPERHNFTPEKTIPIENKE